jgi:putative spermidine/putrescine transport system permease protein
MSTSDTAFTQHRNGLLTGLSDLFWRRPKLLVFLLLAPPLLWLGVIYVGALLALLLQSFYAIDEFSRPIASCSTRPISTSSSAPC